MLRFSSFLFSFLFFYFTFSQIQSLGEPIGFSKKITLPKNGILTPNQNNDVLFDKYHQIALQNHNKMLQYGEPISLAIDFFNEANKQKVNNKNVYHLLIHSSGARSINLIFSDFYLKEGTIMYLFSADKKSYIGAYSSLNNNKSNVLGTELLYSDKIYIEIQEPLENENKSRLTIESVIHGFIDLNEELEKEFGDAGSCNYDVNCSQGDTWQIQRNATVMLLNSSGGFCSGSMINNTSGTEIPYLLTASHCGTNPSAWSFRFRWEAPLNQTHCGTTGTTGNGPTTMVITGAETKAQYNPSDFHLMELNSIPDASWEVYYAGWNRENIPATSGAGIHHPSSDIKKISISSVDYESLHYQWDSGTDSNHWKVYWSEGVTEGGSSGSPIFDQNRRIVGQLTGGASACGSEDQSDFYGKLAVSWEGGGVPSNRLKDWLDPNSTGALVTDASINYALDPYVSGKVLGLDTISCNGTYDLKVIIGNGGVNPLNSATITYNIDGNLNTINWTGSLGLFETDTISIPTLQLSNGQHTLIIEISNPNNNQTDELLSNNSKTKVINAMVNGQDIEFEINFDCYANEFSWKIKNENGEEIISKSGYFGNNEEPYSVIENFCLAPGCYSLEVSDSYGDGLAGGWGCSTEGSFVLRGSYQDTLVELVADSSNFGSLLKKYFCVMNYSGIQEYIQNNIKIYPNPSTDIFYIEGIKNHISIDVYDINGKLRYSQKNSNVDKTKIDVHLEKGVYYVEIINKERKIRKKLIKI
ncbi:MAG: T9SS type A sorting domain-containing protein [Flavobacteriia bacterium]|nr:T9SS type A sorting domain-containing protein [Flavobacteriia bacterium]